MRDVAVWRWDAKSEVFGNSPPNQDPDGDGAPIVLDLRFPGQRYDAASGFNQNGYRGYEPGTGRYPQSDPIGIYGGLSTYAYVGGNPILYSDPYGLFRMVDMPLLPQGVLDFSAGMGDTLSFGLTDVARDFMDTNGVVNQCSGLYSTGEWSGVGLSLAFGGAHLGRGVLNQTGKTGNLARGLRRIASDNRTWNSVQRTWSSSVGGYLGRYELHHWFTPRSAGGSNAIWNYMVTSPRLNNMMSNGGVMYNAFKSSVLGIYGAIPTAAVRDADSECGCE